MRSPASFFLDSIFSPPLLPRMLTKPRTLCACHPVVAMISASVAPLARFISTITSAVLFARSALGLLAMMSFALADVITYDVTVNTSSISGDAGSLDFNFNPGPLVTHGRSVSEGRISGVISPTLGHTPKNN